MRIVTDEYRYAVQKHPNFVCDITVFYSDAVSVIAEELGELAKEINSDATENPGWRTDAIVEAAHVAVTAIRTIEMLLEDGVK